MRLVPQDPRVLPDLLERNAYIEAGDNEKFNYSPANLSLPLPELPALADPELSPHDRLMQLMFEILVVAAREEINHLPVFGPGTEEEAVNRGWIRYVEGAHRERPGDRHQIAIGELRVRGDGSLGPTGLYFAFPDMWATVPSRRVYNTEGRPWAELDDGEYH